jgi:hypothetical protein
VLAAVICSHPAQENAAIDREHRFLLIGIVLLVMAAVFTLSDFVADGVQQFAPDLA